MTRAETKILLGMIVTAYPDSKIAADDRTVDLWFDMLQDLPANVTAAATKAMFATLKWPPKIADIREAVARAQSEARGDLSAGEAWGRVRRAVSRFGYYQPEAAREFLGATLWAAIDQIGGWAYLCTTEDDASTLSAQFERRYKAAAEQQKYRDMVPQAVQDHLKALGAGQGMKMIGGGSGA